MNRPLRTARSLLGIGCVLAASLTGLIGCGGESAPVSESDPDRPRIVSLTPAVTQMLLDLGREEQIVGVGQYDPAAPEDRPIVGDALNIDYEKLLAVRPTHVFIQPEREIGVPDKLQRLAEQRGWTLGAFRIDRLKDITETLHAPGSESTSLGEALGAVEEARRLAERIGTRLDQLRAWTADRPAPKTLIVFRVEPLGAVGRNTFLHEMLTIAGGRNALEGESYQTLDREKLLAMQPEAIVLMVSPEQLPEQRIEAWKGRMRELTILAAEEERIHVVRDPLALLPSSAVPRIAAELARRLHPELGDRIDRMLADRDGPR
jgi:iron complex transport system substrate-binding protein